MKKTYKTIFILVNLIIFLIFYLINNTILVNSFLEYTKLFITKLFPISFTFFIISSLLNSYKFIETIEYYLHINTTSTYILLLSMISGFPSGAKYIRDALDNNLITIDEANKFIMFSHFPNPLFVLSTVNYIINDNSICIKILISIIISNIIIYLFNHKSTLHNNYNLEVKDNFSKNLVKAITTSFNTIIIIYGTSIFFYLMCIIICKYFSFNTYSYVLLNGLFDLTKGVMTTSLINDTFIKCIFIIIFISFGGISIHMQTKSILSDTQVNYKEFIKGRIIGTILSIIIFCILFNY